MTSAASFGFPTKGLSASSVFMDESVFSATPTVENRENHNTGLEPLPYTGLPILSKPIPIRFLNERRTHSLLGGGRK